MNIVRKCLYCNVPFDGWCCDDCRALPPMERIEQRLKRWQVEHPPGSDYSGEGHLAPPTWSYDFWRECAFSDSQLEKAAPTLGSGYLSMEWRVFDGELVSRLDLSPERRGSELDLVARDWSYSLEIGNDDPSGDVEVAYFWRCNSLNVPMRHWEPREGGRYMQGGVAGEWVNHPQPPWAVTEGVLVHAPTVQQVRHFVDTGRMPKAEPGQWLEQV